MIRTERPFCSYFRCVLYVLPLTLAIFLCFWHLGSPSISLISDEVIHIRVTQEMYQSGMWWLPTHGGQPYFNKPPFKMWLTLPFLWVFNEGNFSYRFVDALAGVGTVLIVLLLARAMNKRVGVGAIASSILLGASSYLLGRHGVRMATQDSMLVMLCALALYFFYNWYKNPERRGYLFFFGFTTGAALLTKSAAGALPLFIAGVFLLIRRVGIRPLVLPIVIAAIIPSLYYVPHFILTKKSFKIAVQRELVKRATVGMHNQGNTLYYVRALFSSPNFFPSSRQAPVVPAVSFAVALLYACYQIYRFRDEDAQFLLIWVTVPLFLFSIPHSRLIWYIAPAIPAIAMLIARMLYDLYAYVGRALFLRRYPMVLAGSCAAIILTIPSVNQLIFVTKRVVSQPLNPMALDLLVQRIQSDPEKKKLILYAKVSLRANPQRGKFNPEGIYLRMLGTDLVQVKNEDTFKEALNKFPNALVLCDSPGAIPEEYSCGEEIAPFHVRKNAIRVCERIKSTLL